MTNQDALHLTSLIQAPEFLDAIEAAMTEEAAEAILQMRSAVENGDIVEAAVWQGSANAMEGAVDVLRAAANKFRPVT